MNKPDTFSTLGALLITFIVYAVGRPFINGFGGALIFMVILVLVLSFSDKIINSFLKSKNTGK